MVKINDLLKKSQIDIHESILILCKLLNVDKTYIFTYGDTEVSVSVGKDFLKLIEKRQSGYPIQYILGEREFMGIDFHVEDGVLIPREDTETLVNYIIKYINDKYSEEKIKVLDLGFGSGAISLSIAYHSKNTKIYGVDISDDAYKVAQKNKNRLGLDNVVFLKGDLFKALENHNIEEKFNIIVSNPPYIETDTIETLDSGVKDFEPRIALDGGTDGLDFYRKITSIAGDYLTSNGLLIYEIGYNQGEKVKALFISNGFRDINILKDLYGNDRVVLGFK